MKNNLNLNKKHISFYWFVPLLALIITASLIWQNSFNKGELVKLHIAEATGIEMGKTLVKFHSVPVGLVENVVLNDSLDGAVVSIRMNPNTDKLLNEDTKFWVVKPTIQTNNISGLETILSGVYIQLSKGKSSHYSSEFYAVDKAPIFSDENTEYIQLNLIGLGSKVIKNGVPINYHGFQIGAIESNNFDGKLGKVVYIAKIKKKFAYLIDTNSVFWIDNGINMTFNTNGFNFNMQNLDNLILGSISVDNQSKLKGRQIQNNDKFDLYANQAEASLNKDSDSLEYVVFLKHGMQNLSVGSEVNFRGISAGSVSIVPFFEKETDKFDVNKDIPALISISVPSKEKNAIKYKFDKLLKQGLLCANVDSKSFISPGSVINLNSDTKSKCFAKNTKFRGISVIPVVDSVSLTQELNTFSRKLNKLDLDKLSNNLNTSLDSLNKTILSVNEVVLELKNKETISKLNSTIESYDENSKLYKSITELLDKLNNNMNELSPTIKKLGQKSNSLVFSGSDDKDVEPSVR